MSARGLREGGGGGTVLSGTTSIVMTTRVFILILAGLVGLAEVMAAQPVNYVPMRVLQTEPVVFPRRVNRLGISSGEARVSLQVDEKGRLTDHLVTAYSHEAFAESAVDALKRWKYDPAYWNGEPRAATLDLTFDFEVQGLVVVDMSVSSYVEMRHAQLAPGTYAYRARTLSELDGIPTPSTVVAPVYPLDRSGTPRPAKVTVTFYIDEQGRVRLPAVSRETTENAGENFAAAAVDAVSKWQFEPPMSRGRPVLVAARQEFNFRPTTATTADAVKR